MSTFRNEYFADILDKNDDRSWGGSVCPDCQWDSQNFIEDDAILLAHIVPTQIKNNYKSQAAYQYAHPGYSGKKGFCEFCEAIKKRVFRVFRCIKKRKYKMQESILRRGYNHALTTRRE
jgi:hypothetical protein